MCDVKYMCIYVDDSVHSNFNMILILYIYFLITKSFIVGICVIIFGKKRMPTLFFGCGTNSHSIHSTFLNSI